MNLAALLLDAVRAWPSRVAFELPRRGSITFEDLYRLSDDVARALEKKGVKPGDRVGVCLPKSIDSVGAIFGILKAGAAYVPTGTDAPAARSAYVFGDCEVRAAFVDSDLADAIFAERADAASYCMIPVSEAGDGSGLRAALGSGSASAETYALAPRDGSDTAYVLYTSGSTGVPKGVTISHQSARSFIDWCGDEFAPGETDRFSSHAPFHFNLSILDVYVPMTGGATSVLISDSVSKDPKGLAELIEREGITSWYSTPSVLGLMVRFGGVANRDLTSLRTVLFAGEVMPIGHLRTWTALAPQAVFYNLYGPTETNVCTYLRIPDDIPEDRETPYPIGSACPHYRIRVVDEDGAAVSTGEEGELVASGPGVMTGYWNRPDLDDDVFFADESGGIWYRTGDIVADDGTGVLDFRGRRDRMVKRRGYRVELDEIEVALHAHPEVVEAGVVASEHPEDGVRIHAFLTSGSGDPLSIIALKTFCLERLPPYMVPDRFAFEVSLPKTRTDKVDYVRLRELAAG